MSMFLYPIPENLANSKPVPNTKPMVSQQQFQQQQSLSNSSMQQQQPRPQFQHHQSNLNRSSTGPAIQQQHHQVMLDYYGLFVDLFSCLFKIIRCFITTFRG